MVKKSETIGFIGEHFFKKEVKKEKIPIKDLRKEYIIINGRKIYTHPFDFIVNKKNVEIKTCTLKENKFAWSWYNSNVYFIDYIVGIALDNNKSFKFCVIFDKEFINNHKTYSRKIKDSKIKLLSIEEVLEILKQSTNNPPTIHRGRNP